MTTIIGKAPNAPRTYRERKWREQLALQPRAIALDVERLEGDYSFFAPQRLVQEAGSVLRIEMFGTFLAATNIGQGVRFKYAYTDAGDYSQHSFIADPAATISQDMPWHLDVGVYSAGSRATIISKFTTDLAMQRTIMKNTLSVGALSTASFIMELIEYIYMSGTVLRMYWEPAPPP